MEAFDILEKLLEYKNSYSKRIFSQKEEEWIEIEQMVLSFTFLSETIKIANKITVSWRFLQILVELKNSTQSLSSMLKIAKMVLLK